MDIVEIVWTVVASLGLLSSAVMCWFVSVQWRVLRGVTNGKRRQLYRNVRTEAGRALIHIINMVLGVGAILDQQPVREANGAWILVFTSSILMLNTLLDAYMSYRDYEATPLPLEDTKESYHND